MQQTMKQLCTTFTYAIGLLSVLIIWLGTSHPPTYAAAGDVYCVVPIGAPSGGSLGPFDLCDQVFTTTQQAVDAASGGEEIWVAGGVYTDVSPRLSLSQTVYVSQSLIIRGGYTPPFSAAPDPIANPTIWDSQGQGRVLSIAEMGVVTIENFHMTGGRLSFLPVITNGGSIFNQGSLTMINIVVNGNSANFGEGGGIFNTGELTMTNVIISGNNTGLQFGSGGGIHNEGLMMIIGSVIEGNGTFESRGGGGIFNAGTLTIQNSTVDKNSNGGFFGSGGGIANAGTMRIANTVISNNRADSPGGGIDNQNGADLMIVNSTVSSNTAAWGGGGINNSGTLTITNATISANNAITNACCGVPIGGIGVLNNGILSLSFTTVASNSADIVDFSGGGINNRGQIEFGNSVIAGNTMISGQNDCVDTGSLTSMGYNLVGVGTGCPTVGSDQTVDPADVFVTVLGPLRDNGGATETHALIPGSPAIDAADNNACPATDQRGRPRPVDGDYDGTVTCDIGAFERQRYSYFPVIVKNE